MLIPGGMTGTVFLAILVSMELELKTFLTHLLNFDVYNELFYYLIVYFCRFET